MNLYQTDPESMEFLSSLSGKLPEKRGSAAFKGVGKGRGSAIACGAGFFRARSAHAPGAACGGSSGWRVALSFRNQKARGGVLGVRESAPAGDGREGRLGCGK